MVTRRVIKKHTSSHAGGSVMLSSLSVPVLTVIL